ncbi:MULTISPECIES: MFS transporter [unclassified Cupriavidus]|uniref:MFS transporter n=1 Tax=unclassified Cupriavidus TaxID=2640874 RepID=UPI001C0027AD|nr:MULTISPECIES: MFS transporter [unclassified Cupriavidus]MCA3191683.1 MFS transporter [Cupriavidus sp.]MCA3197913.1 MFS transporter [Cupriavidus sp.]MCA3200597.1 MFS transporter [Cupriavidus sp.]MCA3208245.1 MFS transporter [Cupriavidus sp.]MCA3236314.1 MFS transporter [Cupriavidus sp.]
MSTQASPWHRLRAGVRWLRLLSHRQRQTLVMMLLGLTTGVEFLENIMFVFASSHIVGGIDADPRSFALVQAAYAVGSMMMILKQQWLAQRFGYRYYLTGSLLLFMSGTVVAATSTGLPQMVVARFMQGVGGGALFTSCRILVNLMFTPADRPRASRFFMLGIFGASAMAPAFAAELVEHGVWQDVFYGVLPFAALAAIGTWLLLPDAEPRADHEGPALGPLLLFGVAIVTLQASMTEARFDIFSHPLRVGVAAAVALALLGAFLWQQWHHDTPVLHLRALRQPVYMTGLAMYFVYYMISNLSSYVFPIYAEQALRFPLATTGWLNTLAALISLAGIWIYLRVARRLTHKKPVMVTGLLLMAAAMAFFSFMPPDIAPAALVPGLVAKGLFGVMVIIPIAGLTFRTLSGEDFAHGYRSKNLVRQIASSFASSLGAVLLQNRQFAVHTSLVHAIGQRPAETESWMHTAQSLLVARGFDAGQAHAGALAQMAAIVDQQARLIACEDLYRLIAAIALVAAGFMLVQRRLD